MIYINAKLNTFLLSTITNKFSYLPRKVMNLKLTEVNLFYKVVIAVKSENDPSEMHVIELWDRSL